MEGSMSRKNIKIEHDHETKWIRLCWRNRVGGAWNKGAYVKMTDSFAQMMVKWNNLNCPELEHWTEELEG